ncbi:tRNA pseudouridine(38-40) synthase TruA [Parenemella sanctibonifatiensis]|uniref:tRNA pseudouridine synthase A n=1 Tax=Parenemella sanctibonifatiensis TaxID=2016505 RepID=A0A255EC87_9ACTN|nr:tRNA pseudouridine(38-40) synthase TruA [Parenemella sanctibonifatiensis]OYN89178.1 tRNA pseudouridine(38-40) synthase TruA [Parenemella sanctibonifatiensis]
MAGTRRLRIDLAYDGRDFHGWAEQPGLRSVQGELQSALATILRQPSPPVTCAGRTDAGVHARGQVCHLDLPADLDPAQLKHRLTRLLPKDISVRQVAWAPPDFDARFAAIWRRYAYRIADGRAWADPLLRGHVLFWPAALSAEVINEVADDLLGLHDFAAFCKRRDGATTIRTLLDLTASRRAHDGVVEITVRADAFCHSMVRSLTGALVDVAQGRRSRRWLHGLLLLARRSSDVRVLPAHGLTLEQVGYPPSSELAIRSRQARARRERAPGGGV